MKIVQLLFIGFLSCVNCEEDFDCSGKETGICRSPADCIEEYNYKCSSLALSDGAREGGDARCCPDPLRVLTEEDFSDRRAMCRNRKCLRYYNGWWSRSCPSPSRTLYLCPKTGRYCCSTVCRIRPRCVALGGFCFSNAKQCEGQVFRKLCRGHKCFCCVPGNETSTNAPVTIPTFSSSNTSITTQLSLSDKSTVSVLSSSKSSVLTSTISSTGDTTLSTTGTRLSTLEPCEITGESVHTPCSGPRGCTTPGIQLICPYSNCPPVKVRCTDDGYTVVIYRNMSQQICNFSRNWDEYKQGFCDASSGEYWIGNEVLYALTKNGPSLMKMVGTNGSDYTTSLYYGGFQVLDEAHKYRVSVTDFNHTLSNGINLLYSTPSNNTIMHNMNFSTYDQDNDAKDGGSCSNETEYGGWWFNGCTNIKATRNSQIDWYFWTPPAYTQSLMKEFLLAIKPGSP